MNSHKKYKELHKNEIMTFGAATLAIVLSFITIFFNSTNFDVRSRAQDPYDTTTTTPTPTIDPNDAFCAQWTVEDSPRKTELLCRLNGSLCKYIYCTKSCRAKSANQYIICGPQI